MGRRRIFDDDKFAQIMQSARTVERAAGLLGCSLASVYKHARRLGIDPPLRTRYKEQGEKIAKEYKGKRTIQAVARITGFSVSTARYHLSEWISETWNDPRHPAYSYAVPISIKEIKLVNALIEDEKLFDTPDDIAKITNLPVWKCREYVALYWQRMKRKAKAPPPEDTRKGRRAGVTQPPTPVRKLREDQAKGKRVGKLGKGYDPVRDEVEVGV